MIAAKEIRIGNLYNRKHGKGWTETIITEEIIGKIFSGNDEYALNDFEPIILTSQILDAFGFKHDMVYKWRYSLGTFVLAKTIIDWSAPATKDNNCFSLALDYGNQLSTQTKYVHQLQNLFFALTGEELTYNQ